jgi:hypothetical protein
VVRAVKIARARAIAKAIQFDVTPKDRKGNPGPTMIISYKYNFIYFRPKKTSSTTIVNVLRPNLGKDDVDPKGNGRSSEHAHVEAKVIQTMVSEEFWNKAFKFASERHPYEKAVSLTYYRIGKSEQRSGGKNKDFSEMLNKAVASDAYCGFRYYSIDGRSVADDFVRQENLLADLKRVGERLGLPIPDELPRHKGGFRSDHRPAREILTAEQKEIIYEKCRPEFDLFGYER